MILLVTTSQPNGGYSMVSSALVSIKLGLSHRPPRDERAKMTLPRRSAWVKGKVVALRWWMAPLRHRRLAIGR